MAQNRRTKRFITNITYLVFRKMSSPQTPQARPKRYWSKMALAVAAAVTITVFVTTTIFGGSHATINNTNVGMYSAGVHSEEVMSGQIVLNPKGSYLTGFVVPDDAVNATLQGNYTTAEDKATSFTVWSQQEFLNYFSNQNSEPTYNKNLMPINHDEFCVPVSSGYYLILVNGAGYKPAVLETQLTLNFTIPS